MGCHSMDVIGPLCQSNCATCALILKIIGEQWLSSSNKYRTYCDCRILRRSHTLTCPSSSPLTSRYDVDLFQPITLTLESCTGLMDVMLWCALDRMSHIRIVRSEEHEATQ